MKQSILLLAVLVVGVLGGAVELTEDNFDDKLAGKSAFIKFLADWNKLGDEFADSKTIIIGDVDCTVHENLCQRFGVQGYPTLKYFTDATSAEGDDYQGGRDFDSLLSFAKENLGPVCGPDNKDLCKPEQLKEIEDAEKLSDDELEKKIAASVKVDEDAEELFKNELEKLQSAYEALMKDKEATQKGNAPTLRLYRSIAASRKKGKKEKKEEKKDEL